MERLYKYQGSISSLTCKGSKATDIILYDMRDPDKAPTRLEVFGGLAKYIYDIEMTDAEERYIDSDWYYDSNLYLHRIEVPSNNESIPAKVITQTDFLSEELAIFGPQDYIEIDSPEPMTKEQRAAWYEYRNNH